MTKMPILDYRTTRTPLFGAHSPPHHHTTTIGTLRTGINATNPATFRLQGLLCVCKRKLEITS